MILKKIWTTPNLAINTYKLGPTKNQGSKDALRRCAISTQDSLAK